MNTKQTRLKVGEWAFLLGIVLAALLGAFPGAGQADLPAMVLGILGLVVGLLNITAKETNSFLIAAIALLLAGSAGLEVFPELGTAISSILYNINQFVAPAAMIVALKTVVDLARKA